MVPLPSAISFPIVFLCLENVRSVSEQQNEKKLGTSYKTVKSKVQGPSVVLRVND